MKFQQITFPDWTEKVIQNRKYLRAQTFAKHRILETLINLNPSDNNASTIIESYECYNLSTSQFSNLLESLSKLIVYENLIDSILLLLGDLTSHNNNYCEILRCSSLYHIIINLISATSSGVTEKAVICIGNVVLGSELGGTTSVDLGAIEKISEYLHSDYEKPSETLKTCLWCFWCFISNEKISESFINYLIDLLCELYEYTELHKEVLEIAWTLGEKKIISGSIERLVFVLCNYEFIEHKEKSLCIMALQNFLYMQDIRKTVLEYFRKAIILRDESLDCIYKALSEFRCDELSEYLEVFAIAFEEIAKGIDSKGFATGKFLVGELKEMNSNQIIKTVSDEMFMNLKDAMTLANAQIGQILVEICSELLRAGLESKFCEFDCLDALSLLYFKLPEPSCSQIHYLFSIYFDN
ncbi:hypothetical protein SteCoe_23755 [Stentor coeruleus]|uniref:Uncharacterized protein n=1 Tax=Stentor coeruleus TaxID=5963 RepID=A0A1R2BJ21_9CILI|nr:hypothetical protein SteCoe_23755 [Stentor coeruleus]